MLLWVAARYDGVLVVPMTLTNPAYEAENIGTLRLESIEVRHFVLLASKATLLKRLRKCFDGKNSWPAQQIDRCLDAFACDVYAEVVDTEGQTSAR